MNDFARSLFDNEEGKQRAKEQVSHLEEVAGPDLSCIIMQKRPLALSCWARRTHAPHVLPEQAEKFPMPPNHCLRLHNEERLFPHLSYLFSK